VIAFAIDMLPNQFAILQEANAPTVTKLAVVVIFTCVAHVTVAADPVISHVKFQENVQDNTPVLELNVNHAFVLGHKSQALAVKNAGKQEVSVASFATVIVVGTACVFDNISHLLHTVA
jgi:hypothetical protein